MERASSPLIRLPTARLKGGPELPSFGFSPLITSFFINLLSLAMPLVILQVYDRIIPNQSYGTLTMLVIGLSVALLLDALLRIIRSYTIGWSGARFEHLMATAAIERLLNSNATAYGKDTPGTHLARINAIDTLREFHSGQAKTLLIDLPFVALFLAVTWFIAGSLVLVPIALLAALGVASLVLGRKLKESLKTRNDVDERRYSFIIEVLDGIHTVKGLAMEAPMDRRYERLQQGAAMATYDTAFLSNLAQGMGTLFSNVTLVAVVSAGALLVVGGELSVGGLAACTLLAGRIIQPMLRAAGLATQLESVLIASDRVAEIFETPSEADDRTVDLLEITGAVEFRNVSYRYDGDDKDVLRNVNLNIRAGEMIAISGEVGSGKSTLLSLLMRMAVPTEGEILFDGISTDQLDPLRLREQIAYLSQSPLVVSGTIMENLTLFRKGDAIDEAMKAGRLIGLDQVVNRLPRGYDTLIGAGAERKLPVGVLQSIANARALAGSRPVIIFDSGETGLDSLSNQKLHNAFATLKGTATIIIVSFRPSLTKLADRHFELRDGELHEVTLTSDAEAIGPGESKPPQPKTSPSNRLGLGLATGSGGAQ